MKPLALPLCAEDTPGRVERVPNRLEELELEEALGRTHRVTGVDDHTVIAGTGALVDDKLRCVFEEELEARVGEGSRDFLGKVFLERL
jgi:hypothetical protein